MTAYRRLAAWLIAMSFNSVVYFGSSFLSGGGTVLPESAIDQFIGVTPWAIVPYLSFFLLIPLAFLKIPEARVWPLAAAIMASSFVAAVVFLVCPTTLAYPRFPVTDLAGFVTHHLRGLDTPQNCLPSLHGAITYLCLFAWLPSLRRPAKAVLLAWGASICWSAIALRQHLAIDITAGILLGAICAGVVFRSFARRRIAIPGRPI